MKTPGFFVRSTVNKNLPLLLLGSVSITLLSGCWTPHPGFAAVDTVRDSAWHTPHRTDDALKADVLNSTPIAVKQLVERIPAVYRASALLVGTVVDANHLGSASALGRLLGEQVQAGVVSAGFGVLEMRLRQAVAIRDTAGELLLSREVQDLAQHHHAKMVIVGTYTAAETMTFVHLKAIRTEDGVIEATAEFSIPNDANVRRLLGRY